MNEDCGVCRYSRVTSLSGFLECQRKAPVGGVPWSEVRRDDWCDEFSPAPGLMSVLSPVQALQKLVEAEDQFVAESGVDLCDSVSDAVKEARATLRACGVEAK